MRIKNYYSAASVFLHVALLIPALLSASPIDPGSKEGKTHWSHNPFEQKVFIENIGQFDGEDPLANTSIRFGVDNMGYKIYFHDDGLTYRMDQISSNGEELKKSFWDHFRKEKELKLIVNPIAVHAKWLNANPHPLMVTEDAVTEYYSYSKGKDSKNRFFGHAKAWKKIIYKNLYDGIDVEYTFHSEQGIKYNLIVHPGADLSRVQLFYEGQQEIVADALQNLHFKTPAGEIVDHAPLSYYEEDAEKKPIASSFLVNLAENIPVVRFSIGEYDHSKTIVIDPWTIIPTQLSASGKAFDVRKDGSGNAYVYGGFDSYKLVKYDKNGTLLWVYSILEGGDFAGDIAVDPSGICYLTTSSVFEKIDKDGNQVYSTIGPLDELWRLNFNCSFTSLTMAGAMQNAAFWTVNMKTKTFSTVKNALSKEVRSLTMAPNGNWYAITVDGVGSTDHRLLAVKSDYKYIFDVPIGYPLLLYYGAAYANAINEARCPINGIRADLNYIYTSDGGTLKKWTLKGVLLKQASISGGSSGNNGGIAIDSCGNIYVGTGSSVIKYDSTLTQVASAPILPPAAVYDVFIGTQGEILACGDHFVASLQMGACTDIPCCPTITVGFNVTNSSCSAHDGAAKAIPIGGTAPYKYKWSTVPVQTTQTAKNLAAGVYVVDITDANGCLSSSSVTVNNKSGLLDSISSFNNVSCNGGNDGSATIGIAGGLAPYDITWNTNPVQKTLTATNLPAGTYTCTVKDVNLCEVQAEVIISEPFPLNANLDSKTDVRCHGDSTGEAKFNGSGGTPPFRYEWNTIPVQRTSKAIGLKAGSYQCTVTDTNNCIQIVSVDITEPAGLSMKVSGSASCETKEDGIASVEVSGGSPPYSYVWNGDPSKNTASITHLSEGKYHVRVTDQTGCSETSEEVLIECTEFHVAEVFTPFNEGENNLFNGYGKAISDYEFDIYDRWGARLFHTDKPGLKEGWNGRLNNTGEKANLGIYVYIAKVKDTNGKIKTYSGTVALQN